MGTANDVLRIALGEEGYSRWNDPEAGTKYGRWYAELTGSSYFGQNGVPYCAMFGTWVYNQAGVSVAGLPGAYCPSILNAARNAGATVSNANAQPGDALLFDWEGDGTSDHFGICVANHPGSGYMNTIEGNTDNGIVAQRTRYYGNIVGVIRPSYGGGTNESASSSQESSGGSSEGGIEVDGQWGKETTRAVQRALGTTVDGIVSQQYAAYKSQNPGLFSSSWEWVQNPSGGSDMVRALQSKVGTIVDGYVGPATITALQRYLGTYQDGYCSNPSDCVRELQRRINAGTF